MLRCKVHHSSSPITGCGRRQFPGLTLRNEEGLRQHLTKQRKEATVAVKCLGNRRQGTKSSQNLTRIVYSTRIGQSLKDHAQKSTGPSLNKPRCSFFDVNVTSILEERINQPRSLVEGALSAHLDAYLKECEQQKPISNGCRWMKMSMQQGWNCKMMPERTYAPYFLPNMEMVNWHINHFKHLKPNLLNASQLSWRWKH